MKTPIYLDYAATTPVDPRVAEAMAGCLTMDGNFGNPASRSHAYGWKAEEAVENARANVADLIGADAREIVWTSGATEANNLALKGFVEALLGGDQSNTSNIHIVCSLIEHKAVLDVCASLEKNGVEISYIAPSKDGIVTPQQLLEVIRDNTRLVSIMHVNNEIGTVNDIAALGQVCRNKGIVFHVDAAQSPGKVAIDVKAMNVDLMSLSAHKMYGPKGVGALYVRRAPDIVIASQIDGGGQERGMRSGTLPTHQIVGMGEAAKWARELLDEDCARIRGLRDRFLAGLEGLEEITINGSMTQRVVGNLNISFAYVEGETLLMSLRDLALSTGSACTSLSVEPSYVLSALGVEPELAHSSLRISFGRFTCEENIDTAVEKIVSAVTVLRSRSSQWQKRNGKNVMAKMQ